MCGSSAEKWPGRQKTTGRVTEREVPERGFRNKPYGVKRYFIAHHLSASVALLNVGNLIYSLEIRSCDTFVKQLTKVICFKRLFLHHLLN